MDINLLRSLVTVASLAAFLGIVWWAYGPARKERFERDALLPFGDDEEDDAASAGPSPLRPRRAEQVPSVLCLDATPERDAAPEWSACLRAPSRSHPRKPGPLLHVSAHPLPRGEGKWTAGNGLSAISRMNDRERP